MKRKYLDNIGVIDRPDKYCKNDGRKKKWNVERKTYGFDERETWDLRTTFYCWLYERLKMYTEINDSEPFVDKFEYNGKVYTQKELIDMMIERLEYFFKEDLEVREKNKSYISEIEKIWAVILPAMWW